MGNKEKIIGLLKDNPHGLTIEELSLKAELSRVTVRVILTELKAEGFITQRAIGQAKLNYWVFS